MELGNKIIKLRKKKKLSQEQLGDILGVTRQTISNWELNITKPDIKQVKEISKTFNISIDELLNNNIKNIFVEKANNTEKIVKKNTRKILIILYILILSFLISVILYCLLKRDFTTKYQTEFTCINNEEIYYISFTEESDGIYLEISQVDEINNSYNVEEKYNVGNNVLDVLNTAKTIKEYFISSGATCK